MSIQQDGLIRFFPKEQKLKLKGSQNLKKEKSKSKNSLNGNWKDQIHWRSSEKLAKKKK